MGDDYLLIVDDYLLPLQDEKSLYKGRAVPDGYSFLDMRNDPIPAIRIYPHPHNVIFRPRSGDIVMSLQVPKLLIGKSDAFLKKQKDPGVLAAIQAELPGMTPEYPAYLPSYDMVVMFLQGTIYGYNGYFATSLPEVIIKVQSGNVNRYGNWTTSVPNMVKQNAFKRAMRGI